MQPTSKRAVELQRLWEQRRNGAAISPTSPSTHSPINSPSLPSPSTAPHLNNHHISSNHDSDPFRPLSFLPSPRGETIDTSPTYGPETLNRSPPQPTRFADLFESWGSSQGSSSPTRSNSASPVRYQDTCANGGGMESNYEMQHGTDTATQSFPLNDIDYESDPVAVAQELSNLQAIRRMSMDVNGADPDLPAFNPNFGVPTVAPSHRSDEEDPSRLFWVPASVHPELAPNQFKTFIQERVRTLKRSSLSEQPLAPENGSGSLRRRKSMLSRQIDNGNGYEDGATRLERQKSKSGDRLNPVNLHDLEDLISDPDKVRQSLDSGSEVPIDGDMPILPAKPAGQTLKRSTRTQYRRGSLRKGGLSGRRQMTRQSEDNQERPEIGTSSAPQLPDVPALPDLSELANATFGLTRVQTEPIPQQKSIENFSRPGRRGQTPPAQPAPNQVWNSHFEEAQPVQKPEAQAAALQHEESSQQPQQQPNFHSRYANGRSTQYSQSIPQIIEPQPEDLPVQSIARGNSMPVPAPERTSSMEQPQSVSPQGPLPRPSTIRSQDSRPQSLPQRLGGANNHRPANITLDDIAGSSSIIPGSNSRSDSISIIPTYHDEGKKTDKKNKKDEGSRKGSWSWLTGGNNEEKEREKREKEEREASRRNKSKLQKPGEVRHDSARLDVLQNSIDGGQRSRQSEVFDRQSLSIPEEDGRRPARKSAGEVKKEKDGNIFSTLFGSSKRRGEKDGNGGNGKKGTSLRGLSPEPPPRILRPDIDYNWSRFSILEERAIYRMAHIKLANPRRELYSQVLLSNFMYSYLAKVQQMHPQIQIPQSAAQKQQQRQEKQRQDKMVEEERKMRQAGGDRQQGMQQQNGHAQAQGQVTVEEFQQYQRYQEHQARLEEQQNYVEQQEDMRQQQQYHHQGYGSPQQQQQQYMNGGYAQDYGQEYAEQDQTIHQNQNHHQQQQWYQPVGEQRAGVGERW